MDKKVLTAAEIFAVKDTEPVEVFVQEWNGSVLLKPISAAEAIAYNKIVKDYGDKHHAAALLVVMSAVTPEGARMFKDEDVTTLANKSLSAILRLQRVALEINGLNDEKKAEEGKE